VVQIRYNILGYVVGLYFGNCEFQKIQSRYRSIH